MSQVPNKLPSWLVKYQSDTGGFLTCTSGEWEHVYPISQPYQPTQPVQTAVSSHHVLSTGALIIGHARFVVTLKISPTVQPKKSLFLLFKHKHANCFHSHAVWGSGNSWCFPVDQTTAHQMIKRFISGYTHIFKDNQSEPLQIVVTLLVWRDDAATFTQKCRGTLAYLNA